MKKTLSKVLAMIIAVMLVLSACPIAFATDGDIASGTAGEGVTWVIDADGTLTISGEGPIVTEWNSPPWYDYNDFIINIVIEEGITKIPSTAFCYAINAVTLSIPASVTEMPINTTPIFWGNGLSLEAINVHEDNPYFTSVDGILFSNDKTMLCVYPMNKAGDSYTIPDTVTDVNAYAFVFNETLKSVVIPDTVKALGNDTFEHAKIESITIGSGIKTIPSSCFGACNYIESIVIPETVETIETSAFWACNNLTNINIGAGIKTIYESAFGWCNELSAIHYEGTQAQWEEVTIVEDEEDFLSNIAIHYVTDIVYKEEPIAPTCTTDGHTAGDYCNACEAYLTGEVTESAWGHYFENGVCQRENCGYVCTHINDIFDDECDVCEEKIELDFPKIKLGETKTAYIGEDWQKTYVEFVPEVTGRYKLFSDNGGDHDNNDPFASVYDSNFEEIAHNDDVESEEHNDYNFLLEFDAVRGKRYYFGLSNYNDDIEYTYTLDKGMGIAHQPTAGEPYVELHWGETGRYLWYELDMSEEITDQDAKNTVYDWGESSYSAQNGWSGVPAYENATEYDFFTVSLEAGETITVELIGKYGDGVGLWDYVAENGVWINSTGESVYEITVEDSGDYTFYTYANAGELTVRAYRGGREYVAVEGQYTNTLENPVIGKNYICVVTLEGATELISNAFAYTYAISHQPTEKEPYVEVNEDTNAKYQWYSVIEEVDEITDEDVSFGDVPPEVEVPTYDAQDGWTGIAMGEETQLFFISSFEAGESIKFVANEHAQAVAMFMPVGGIGDDADFDQNGEAVIIVPEDGEYYVIVLGSADTRLKAYKQELTYAKIDGETATSIANTKVGTSYACEVTFADGTTEMSDIITKRYSDVPFEQWYSDAVEYVSEYGIMTGYGGTNNFGSADKITRHDFVVILARLAGADLSVYDDVEITFGDVADDQYYTNAILWAADVGITTGYAGGTVFGVGDVITREQLVTFLYRYAKYANGGVAPTVSADAADNAAAYADYAAVTDYAQEAIIWALDNGVIKGQGGTHIAPGGNALRCEVAQIMYNIFLNDIF